MLTGLLVPTAGEVIVDNLIPWKQRKSYVAEIGAVFGQRTSLWWDLPLVVSLDLLQHIYKIPRPLFK
jgi:ABC-2 type transport system ATP-binding protein